MPQPATIEEADEWASRFQACLPKELRAASLTRHSKIPFKAFVLREALVHRMTHLALSSVNEMKAERHVSAAVLARAATETTSVLFALHSLVIDAIERKNDARLSEFLTHSLVGARNHPDMSAAINVLTQIDKVEKQFPGFRATYDHLCEYAHPNWAGVLGAFGKHDSETYDVEFGFFDRSSAKDVALRALLGALGIAEHYYNESGERLRDLNDVFETGGIVYDT